MTDHPSARRLGLLVFCGLTAVLLAGCQDDEVRRYQVPRPPAPPAPKANVRLLAAIAPQADRTFFLKLQGPIDAVDPQAEAFDRFIKSVRFTGKADEPAQWTLPEGWKQLALGKDEKEIQGITGGERHARIQVESKGQTLTLDVTSFPGQLGDLRANVNRWRGQIGLPGASGAELGKLTREVEVNGVKMTLVDMAGPGTAAVPPMVAPSPAPAAGKTRLLAAILPQADRTWFLKLLGPADSVAEQADAFDRFLRSVRFTGNENEPMQWTVPEGWKQLPGAGERLATFQVPGKDRPLELAITSFPGKVGTLAANVNRWRGQLGLPPVSDETELSKITKELEVNGVKATVVDMTGPGGGRPMGR